MNIKNKIELLKDIATVMDRYIARLKENHSHSDVVIAILIECYHRFYRRIEESVMLELPEGWSYNWYFTPYSFIVEMLYSEEDGEITQEYTLIDEKVPMMTPEQYAESRNLKLITVQKWISRAKLKTAYKVGRLWKISALTETPTRGYKNASYKIQKPLEDIPEKFARMGLQSNTSSVFIRQIEGRVGFHEVIMLEEMKEPIDMEKQYATHITVSNEEREAFEVYLISEYDVIYVEDPFENMWMDAYGLNRTYRINPIGG